MKPIIGLGGKVRGYIQEQSNGDKTLLAPGGRVLGYFKKVNNQTIRPGGSLYGYGDQLLSLLED